jgi:hypothetical protein
MTLRKFSNNLKSCPCPTCGKEIKGTEYLDVYEGSLFDCPHCKEKIRLSKCSFKDSRMVLEHSGKEMNK